MGRIKEYFITIKARQNETNIYQDDDIPFAITQYLEELFDIVTVEQCDEEEYTL